MKTAAKRVLIAGLLHETHTFLEGRTGLADFEVRIGGELWQAKSDASPLGGVLDVALEHAWDVVPAIDMRAVPSAMVEDEVIEFWWEKCRGVLDAEKSHLDGVFLLLHGAMVCENCLDVEGEVLSRLRRAVGEEIPIGGVTDLHANFTRRMAENSNALITYRENPHTDARETAVRAAHLLERLMASGEKPRTLWEHPPIVWQPAGTGTSDEPMRSLEATAREIENTDTDIFAVNVHAGFAFADTPDTGVSFSVVTIGEEERARAALRRLAEQAMQLKELGNPAAPALQDVMPRVRELLSRNQKPILLVEPADNIGGGAPGDDTAILRALVENRIKDALVIINDADAADVLWKLPPGSRRVLPIGGKGSTLGSGPLSLEIEVVSRSDGDFELEDAHSHMASYAGGHIEMGRCVVACHEGVLILLTSRNTAPMDLGQLRSQNIEPSALSVIGVKAAVAHRRAYDPIAAASFTVDTPGPCAANLQTLPFRHIQRPIYPLDQ